MNKNDSIYIVTGTGLVGSSLLKTMSDQGYTNLITSSRRTLDLRNQQQTNLFFQQNRPKYVFLTAAKVGNLSYNSKYPADFLYDNVMIQSNVINASKEYGCKKLLLLGSSTVYPKDIDEEIKEEDIFTGKLDTISEPYALSKIFGMSMAKYYTRQYGMSTINLMIPNLYGPNDNFDPNRCHVVPSLINKFDNANKTNLKSVEVWGDGSSKREFLYVDDLIDACLFLMNNYDSPEHINVGGDIEITIKDLAESIKNKIGYFGKIFWDVSKPNGPSRRKLDNSKMKDLGWKPKTSFDEGLTKTIEWYKNNRRT